MNRSPSPDLTANRVARQMQRIFGQQVAVAAVQTAGVESASVAAVLSLDVDLTAQLEAIDARVFDLENPEL